MANTFLDMFREFSGRRQQQKQFDAQLAQAEADRSLRREAMAAEQSRFDKNYILQQRQLEDEEKAREFLQQSKVLEGFSNGTLKASPTQQVPLAPTESTNTPSDSPIPQDALGDLPSTHSSTALVSANLPTANSFWLGGNAVQPTTPLERGTDQITLQGKLAEAADERLRRKAASLYDDPDMQNLYVSANGDLDKITNTPESALSAMLLSGKHSQKDILGALGKIISMKYMSRINPFSAQLAQLNIQDKRNQLQADQALGQALRDVEQDPKFANADPITKTAEARRRLAMSNVNPSVVTKGMANADNTQSAPSVPRPKSALEIFLGPNANKFNLSK